MRKIFKNAVVVLMSATFSLQSFAETAITSQVLAQYKVSSRRIDKLVLECKKIEADKCVDYQLVKGFDYVTNNGGYSERKVINKDISPAELKTLLESTIGEKVFPRSHPVQNAIGALFLPLIAVFATIVFPPLWPVIPVALGYSALTLLAFPLAIVVGLFRNVGVEFKEKRWEKLIQMVIEGKEIKRPLKIRKAVSFSFLIQLLTDSKDLSQEY